MGKDLAQAHAVVRDTFAEADAVLGEPLSRLCFEGPAETLMLTENTQPAILATSIAIFRLLEAKGLRPALEGTWKVRLVDGQEVEVATLWTLYRTHLRDYDLDTVAEITHAPKDLIRQLAQDLATLKPAAGTSFPGILGSSAGRNGSSATQPLKPGPVQGEPWKRAAL